MRYSRRGFGGLFTEEDGDPVATIALVLQDSLVSGLACAR